MLRYSSRWYETHSGKLCLGKLDDICADIMSETFGYYALETGVLSGNHDFLKYSRITTGLSLISEKIDNKFNETEMLSSKSVVVSSDEQLPIATDNVDLVVASHVLELSQDPHQVLREIDRVLVPEGHCILIGFNPLVLTRIRRLIDSTLKKRKKDDYTMRSVTRVRDWFSLLGFEVLDVHYMGVRPGFKSKKLFESLSWLDKLESFAGPVFGNMYVLHVKKQVVAMRPHKKVWKAPAVLSGGKVVINSTAQKIRRENYSNL